MIRLFVLTWLVGVGFLAGWWFTIWWCILRRIRGRR